MSPGEWADPQGETAGERRGPVVGSDGAAVPLGGATALPGDGGPSGRWAWDGDALPVRRPEAPSGRSPSGLPAPGPSALPKQRVAADPLTVDSFAAAYPLDAAHPPAPDRQFDTDSSTAVRPYVMTGGRTRPRLELSLETLVSTLRKVIPYQLPHDEAAVLDICRDQPRSVAEVAALHRVPIGVAKILVADLATAGLVTVHQTFAATGSDHALMERVLGGLRRL